MRDLHNNIEVRRAISPTRATDNTALVSQIIDRANFESLEFVIATGTLADADATFTVLVEEDSQANMATPTAVADADLLGTETGASFAYNHDDQVRKIGYIGAKRYVRLTITPANNTGNADISAVAVLGHPRTLPRDSQS